MSNKLKLASNGIFVTCDRGDSKTQELLIPFYPYHFNRIRTQYKLSPRLAPEVLKAFRGISINNINSYPQQIQKFFFDEMSAREHMEDLLKNGPTQDCKVTPTLTLRRHQQLAREIAQWRNRFAFFYDTRTGKTPLSLAIVYDDLQVNPMHKWLVVCPLILIENAWMADATKFVPTVKLVNCYAKTPAARIKAINSSGQLYITNTESFVRYKQYFEQVGFEGCFIDESSDMKSPSSQISKALVDFAQQVKRLYLLSGTPAPNCESEYYMQMRAIDYYGWHQSYAQFKESYFVNLSFDPHYEKLALRPDKKDEFFARVKQYAIYVDKEDVLTTPGRTFNELEYELPAELKKAYISMKNDLYVEVQNEHNILAPSAAAKLNKLNQITSGFIMDTKAIKENENFGTKLTEWYLLDNYRFKALEELLDREGIRGEQVLIWANYRREFELIQNLLGARCACIYGGTNIAEKNEAIRKFKAKELQYLVANPASADKGLTLTNCHIAIYFSLNWSYETYKQSTERIYGDISKQPKHCQYYIMIAKGTIDRILYREVLQGKSTASYAILNHLKADGLSA
jgi:SNF2 family DNA or RNA helicase